MRRFRISILVVTAMAGLAWVAGCGDAATEPAPYFPEPTTVTVSPATAELTALDATVQLTAEVRDQNGNVMAGATLSWASSAATVATVSASGLVTAAGNGAATINATAGSASGSAAVTVAQTVSAVVVTPAVDTLLARDMLRLAAEAMDANGHAVAGQAFSWASSDTAVAAVDDAGLVTGIAAGSAEVTATASGITSPAELTVMAPVATTVAVTPDTLALTAPGPDRSTHRRGTRSGRACDGGRSRLLDERGRDRCGNRLDCSRDGLGQRDHHDNRHGRRASGTALVRVVDMAQFLKENPRIAASMMWLLADGRRKPYTEWPQALRDKLALAVDQLLGEGTGLADIMTNQANQSWRTVFSAEDAEDVYVANIAHSFLRWPPRFPSHSTTSRNTSWRCSSIPSSSSLSADTLRRY